MHRPPPPPAESRPSGELRPFAGRAALARRVRGRRLTHGGTALAALALTAAVPTLSDGAQRVAARVSDAVSEPAFEPPPMPDVEALMAGEPVEVGSTDGLVIPGGSLDEADLLPTRTDRTIMPARAFPRSGTALDRARAQQCLTTAIYYEAASEPTDGKRAVAQVVLNRVLHPAFPNRVCDVVYQGSERATGCQFSFTCDGSMARVPARREWSESAGVAAEALSGRVFAPVGLATHYHTWRVWPRWGRSLVSTTTVGAHIFHRLRGWWGTAPAFRARYAGGEPMPGPHPRLTPPPSAVASTPGAAEAGAIALGLPVPATPSSRAAAPAPATRTPLPVATVANARANLDVRAATGETGNLPTSTIRPEFAESGRWKGAPASR